MTADTPTTTTRGAAEPELVAYLRRQWAWSKNTFGPALRTKGIVQHITKELREIEADPHDLAEWVDVIILAMDGFWRHGGQPEDLLSTMQRKQEINFARKWLDWRMTGEDQAIEHDRSGEATQPAPDATPAQPVSAAGSEPVAWRCRSNHWLPGNNWQFWSAESDRTHLEHCYDTVEPLALHSNYMAAHESAVYWKDLAERHDERIGKLEAELSALRATPTPALAPQDGGLPKVFQSAFETKRRASTHPRIIDLCYTAFMRAKAKNDEDGGPTDWFTDTKPQIDKLIEEMRSSFVAALGTPALAPQPPRDEDMTKQGCPHCGLSADLVQRGSCGHPAAEPCRTPSGPDALPGLKLALYCAKVYDTLGEGCDAIRAEIARIEKERQP